MWNTKRESEKGHGNNIKKKSNGNLIGKETRKENEETKKREIKTKIIQARSRWRQPKLRYISYSCNENK